MYTGVGCSSCHATQLGIAPVVIGEAVTLGVKLFGSLFGSDPRPGNERTIAGWAGLVASNPDAATLTPTPFTAGSSPTPAQAWVFLRCWAGDATATPIYQAFDTVDPHGVCNGSDVAPEARTLIDQLRATYPQLAGPYIPGQRVAVGTYGSPSTPSVPGGTILAPLPGGGSFNVPVPTSSLFGATIAGIPVVALAGGLAVLAFAGGHSRGRSAR